MVLSAGCWWEHRSYLGTLPRSMQQIRRETYKRVANRAQVDRIVALAMKHRPSTDFCGYWQRGRAPRASVTACRVDELPIIGHAHHVRAIRRVRSRFPRGRDTQNPEIAKPASEGGSAYPA